VSFLRYNICSISFRHELVSFRELVHFAHTAGYSGIELWGVHANSLLRNNSLKIERLIEEMQSVSITVSMISDYLDLLVEPNLFLKVEQKWYELISIAQLFKTDKIRIFAGNKASASASEEEWGLCIARLRHLVEISSAYGIYTVIETHPCTFADNLQETLRLLAEVNHEFLCINLDFLHLWEVECPPYEAFWQLKPWIVNFHFKNVLNQESLHVFSPNNVYSPSGYRDGMVPLANGAIDFSEIVNLLMKEQTTFPASIEWFGDEPFHRLRSELQWLKEVEAKSIETANIIL
jgi:3-dehydroshikimate dehydratase